MKDPLRQKPDRGFHRVLADIQRARREEERDGRLRSPAAGAAFPFVENETHEAPDWGNEADFFIDDEPRPAENERLLSDSPEAIALELGLDQTLSEDELNRARRRFMWRNHPDRCSEAQRPLADRRVAVANMLIDRARAKLARARRR
ncbi:MAG TPA: hypothetical protein VKV96_02165 [Roseiarcus sp.]|nr:hypothetical protein [Roseiarcus sp.]